MRPLNIWILQTGEPLHSDGSGVRPMRAINLANALVTAGHNVVVWSSAFYHQEKIHRLSDGNDLEISPSLRIRLIDSPGYARNISFARLWDHFVLARNLNKKLRLISSIPDVAFVGYPPIETAYVMTKWLSKFNTPYVVDVKDQWPQIFVNPLPVFLKPFAHLFLWPYFYLGKQAIKKSSGISAMAVGFLEWAIDFSGRSRYKSDCVVPLTVPIPTISKHELEVAGEWWDEKKVFADSTFRISFVGSHSSAFEMDPVFAAAKNLMKHNANVQFVICGDGPYSRVWQEKAYELNNIVFPGWINQAKINSLYARSNLGLAPYKNTKDFMMSIPNKVIDILSAGLPLLTSLSGEVRQLINDHQIGFFYGQDDKPLLDVLLSLLEDIKIIKKFSQNSLNLYKTEFAFEEIYGNLVKNLELMALKKQYEN